jgi:hypothetical protein
MPLSGIFAHSCGNSRGARESGFGIIAEAGVAAGFPVASAYTLTTVHPVRCTVTAFTRLENDCGTIYDGLSDPGRGGAASAQEATWPEHSHIRVSSVTDRGRR